MQQGSQPCKPAHTYNTYKQKWDRKALSKNNIRMLFHGKTEQSFNTMVSDVVKFGLEVRSQKEITETNRYNEPDITAAL